MRNNICLIFSIVLFASSQNTYSQLIRPDTIYSKITLGVFNDVLYFEQLVEYEPTERVYILSNTVAPHLVWYPYKNFGFGILGSYEFYSSNFYNKSSFIKFGLTANYKFPFKINLPILKYGNFYIESGFFKTNYIKLDKVLKEFTYKGLKIEENYIISNRLNQSIISIPFGVQFIIWERLYFDFAYQYSFFINGISENGFRVGLGFNIKNKTR